MEAAQRSSSGLRLLVTVTFNPNQLKTHLLPLIALEEVESIMLVADVEPPPLPKVTSIVPSSRMRRLLGRAGAKLAVCSRLAQEEHFDWVMGFNFVPHGFNAQLVARRANTRSIYHMIGGEREWLGGGAGSDNKVLGRLPAPSRRIEQVLLRQIRKATIVGTMGTRARALMLDLGFDPDRVVVIPPATDVERFAPQPGPAVTDVLCVAALIERKRVDDLVEALALLRPEHPDLRAVVAGKGHLQADLERLAEERELGGRLIFSGHIEEVERLYWGSRVFVLPSASEGMPIAMLDAMAAGVPVVVPDVGEIGTLVEHGRNGLLYPVGDVHTLAERIATLLGDDTLRETMGKAAREDVVASHSVAAVAQVYRELFARHRTAASGFSLA